jgi:type III pantothenate kinase
MTPNLVFAIDIGNTNTHAGLVDCDGISCTGYDVFPTCDLLSRIPVFLDSLVSAAVVSRTLPLVICSVVKIDRAGLTVGLTSAKFAPPLWFEYSPVFPVKVTYDNPYSLGADRLAKCLYSHASHPGQNQIIIGAGTAITVDFVKNGNEFAGGVILPGLSTQLKSLHDATSALPFVDLHESALEFPGKSTRASMTSGVTFGAAGALSFLVARYKEHYGDALVLVTGGAWKQVEKLVTFEYEYVPEMTVIGTGLFGKWRGKI